MTSSAKEEERVSRRSKDKKVRKGKRGQSQESSQMKSTLENKINLSDIEKEPPKVMDQEA